CGVGNSASNKVWLDVHAMGLPNGAAVSSATDYSGNGNNFLQPTSSRRPINNTGVLNGLPVITFDGINDRLQGGSISDLETSAITYFIVYQRANLKNEMLID